MNSPLLDIKDLPEFSKIQAEQIEPALDELIKEARELTQTLLDENTEYTWANLIEPLETVDNKLSRMWSPISHMNGVVNSPELRDAYNACLPKLSEYSTEMGQNKALFKAIEQIQTNADALGLDDAQRKSLEDSIKGFRLSGVDLESDKKKRYGEISKELSTLTSKYSDNVLDASNAWTKLLTDKSALRGLPDTAIEQAAEAAKQRDAEGWMLTLEFPSYYAVMTYADDRELRAEMYRAYSTRASDQGDNEAFDNSQNMEKILQLRQEKAQLLGFDSYANLSLDTKMAESPEQVLKFLSELAEKSLPFAKKEYEELKQFAEEEVGIADLQAWDVGYVSEKLKQQRYSISDEDLKPYFPVDNVLDGLFELVEKLYNVKITQNKEQESWYPDVRFFHINDAQGNLKARFYLDLYARQNKRGGAWMADFCSRFKMVDKLQTPVAFMTCNSAPPAGGKPALFTHDEVITLFHEFGHGLHHMMTQVDYLDISGISGVEWDAVELPSQFMENWCWQREALDMFAAHYETGEKIPDELFDKMQAARHFQSAMGMVRQLEFSMFDMRLHMDTSIKTSQQVQDVLNKTRDEVAVIHPPTFNRFQHGFSHIFAGGYAAGYYSYKWAEVLSADAFARFEEEGLFNENVGKAFLTEILEVGGSRPAIDSFKAFRGREPKVDALLKHSGLAA
ncbi:M3 family metallopeptidase [Cocleimonas sp. KMM 6892]|uniref:M3 family metallopeptidase n=1 Tax=unclassified Cocleimonas TaxID=2639732 RepID=UPI002DBC9B9A|nr:MULTISPECIES: M3 family metallopeptidase [unclassified Cocleimonas]MEB8431514.1 M3 family metallopeptidase [Cocleimonas sp. KMM 6892]MEC4713714.1 M3 family metallopeptidase [Cocleimonas sp. KMM 6895]MEC4743045.1 M3 family metallopeptidase [Cocleimonas sp. KMM 6896]